MHDTIASQLPVVPSSTRDEQQQQQYRHCVVRTFHFRLAASAEVNGASTLLPLAVAEIFALPSELSIQRSTHCTLAAALPCKQLHSVLMSCSHLWRTLNSRAMQCGVSVYLHRFSIAMRVLQ
jgi:hypothetical protein